VPEIGGKACSLQELENELYQGNVQAAVHSLKDLPVEALRLVLAPSRNAARCAMLFISAQGHSLEDLPEGALVGTSSCDDQPNCWHGPIRSAHPAAARQREPATQSSQGDYDASYWQAPGWNG